MSAEQGAGGHAPGRAATVVSPVRLWRLRLAHGMPRYLVSAAASFGLIASARFAIAPPQAVGPGRPAAGSRPADRAAEGYAALFARRYLTWDSGDPQASQGSLESFAGAAMTPDAGLSLPDAGSQAVEWAEVVQSRESEPGTHVYTVAAQIAGQGLVYLAVGVARGVDGRLALTGYPAFVGPPDAAGARFASVGPAVTDRALAAVVDRALRNYLAGSTEDLDADLSRGARVAVPGVALALEAVQQLAWSRDGRSVVATVEARDPMGVRHTLGYEVDVVDVGGRWEVGAIEMDPEQ